MSEMSDREFVEWCRINQTEMYLLEQQRLLSIALTPRDSRALSVEFICDIATLRLDLAEARAQVAALTAERDATQMKLRDMAPMKYPVLVACALIIRDGKVLLERHAPSIEYSVPQWDIPGGKVEIGETPEQAVVREIKEEMGVTVRPIRLLNPLEISVWTDAPNARHWVLATYECEIADGEPATSDDLQWIDIDRLGDYAVKSPDAEIINGYHAEASRIAAQELLAAAKQDTALTAKGDATDEKHDQIRRIAEAVWNGLNEKTLARIAALEAELAAVKQDTERVWLFRFDGIENPGVCTGECIRSGQWDTVPHIHRPNGDVSVSFIELPNIELVSAKVHDAWMDGKRAKGINSRKAEDGEELMVQYEQLSEAQKDQDRQTALTVYRAMIDAAMLAAKAEPEAEPRG